MIGEPAVRGERPEFVESWNFGFIPVAPQEWGFLAPYWWSSRVRHSILPAAYEAAEELSRRFGMRYRVRLRSNGWVASPILLEQPC